MQFDIKHGGRETLSITFPDALSLGYPVAVAGRALLLKAKEVIALSAEKYRAKLASTSAGKLAEYRIKEEIARDPASANNAELVLLDREAAAKGIDRAALLTIISAKAAAYRQTALMIGALEAEAGAAIDAIPDDAPDIEAQIKTTLAAAIAQAETAFTEALTFINGGA